MHFASVRSPSQTRRSPRRRSPRRSSSRRTPPRCRHSWSSFDSEDDLPLVTIVQLMLPSLDVSGMLTSLAGLEKPPQMDSYDGTTNPNEHMENIEAVLTYREVRGAVKSLRKRGTYRGKEKRENDK